MAVIEIGGASQSGITQRQRWGHYFAVFYAAIALLIGINLRDSSVNAVVAYSNTTAGIRALYPRGWLIDTDGDYVFRVRDLSAGGYKTTIQVAIEPVAPTASSRNIVDALTLARSQRVAAYTPLSRSPISLSDEREALALEYAYVEPGDNVFLSAIPNVVSGLDIIVLQRGQAIIISFLSDSDTYDSNYPVFQRFLDALVF
ncbi:MAG: hypothetical protein SGJ24_08235 [Chloroflexota bacterium]|nr:hypothetical protein [Chloroflexota bacterium]